MPFNKHALEHPRGCDTTPKYVSMNSLYRRDYGHCYNRPYYPHYGKYWQPGAGTSASFATTPNYTYGCPCK